MPSHPGWPQPARNRGRRASLACVLAATLLAGGGCRPREQAASQQGQDASPALPAAPVLISQLTGARLAAARTQLELKRPDEALALLVAALQADPAAADVRALAAEILAETVWNFPVLRISHHLPIQHLAFQAPASLWVALGGSMNTTVRWDLEKPAIDALLFPVTETDTRSLVLAPDGGHAVISRGKVSLLCDAQTLKPVRDLGPLPDELTPASVVVFSPEGLLVASPTAMGKTVTWHLRDTATGEIVRSAEAAADDPPPLAAHLDRARLRVLRADGSLWEMPVSPVEPARTVPPPEPVELLHGQFSADGNAALVLQGQGAHERPAPSILSWTEAEDDSLEVPRLRQRFPWGRGPSLWNGLLADEADRSFRVAGNVLEMTASPHAPVTAGAEITAAAFADGRIFTGDAEGTLLVHQLLPVPGRNDPPGAPAVNVPALAALAECLTGLRHEGDGREFARLSAEERLAAAARCDFTALAGFFPELDFAALEKSLESLTPRAAPPEALVPLWHRLAQADLTGERWPEILRMSQDLAHEEWHQWLTAKVVSKAPGLPPEIAAAFDSGEDFAVFAAIADAGKHGRPAANALARALASEHPEWIQACLANAENLPPLLRQIALSRSSWLDGKKAAALSPWPQDFPEMREIRQREDWQGWEGADFAPALEAIRGLMQAELRALEVPADSTPEQRQEIAARLADPETVAAIGKPRFALACMHAATAFSAFPEDAETTRQLAQTARDLGAPAAPCLRAEAMALTALGEFSEAHQRWVELLTEQPLGDQEPGDYAEAAYTAFENADPQQAMTILTTGMHRYPQDAHFALRAGWVALLTGNSQRAYDFLRAGQRVGYAADRQENATALLVISAAQSGAYDDATVYFQDLVRLDPAWARAETLDTLDWPDELKSVLLQFMH